MELNQMLSLANAYVSRIEYSKAISTYKDVLEQNSSNIVALYRLGLLMVEANRFSDAAEYFSKGFNLYPSHFDFGWKLCEVYRLSKEYQLALDTLDSIVQILKSITDPAVVSQKPLIVTEISVNIAGVLFDKGDHLAAAQIFGKVLKELGVLDGDCIELPEDPLSTSLGRRCAVGYARSVLKLGEKEQSLKVLLRVMAVPDNSGKDDPTCNPGIILAEVLRNPGGLALLFKQLQSDHGATASALAYIAVLIKDHGSVAESVVLMRRALTLQPSSVSYALNAVHSLEVLYDYGSALKLAASFLANNPSIKIGGENGQPKPVLKGSDVLDIIGSEWVKSLPGDLHSNGMWSRKQRGFKLFMRPEPSPSPVSNGGKNKSGSLDMDCQIDNRNNSPYSDKELDFVALCFAIVKILYLIGMFEPIARLIEVIDAIRTPRLHLTTVRNEHAYYCCVKELVELRKQLKAVNIPENHVEPLYCIGDSHSLPAGWWLVNRAKKSDDQSHYWVTVPMLSTGTKIWHLRSESRFYPKYNFENAVSHIPDGSSVAVLIGEIDCREGLLTAVSKARYKTIDDAIESALDIYMAVLLDLAGRRGFTVYVHPVPSVLAETRRVVLRFNTLLKTRTEKCGLKYLDFGERVLNENKTSVLPEYELDGSHLGPSYLVLLEEALGRL